VLILKKEDVNYCSVIRHAEDRVEKLPGLAYQDKLFLKKQSFRRDQTQVAIEQSRQKHIAGQEERSSLLVEDAFGITLWIEDQQVKLAQDSSHNILAISNLDLEELVAKMRTVGGIKIQDRIYHLKTYARCFVGSEAVEWFMNQFALERKDAILLGQRLVDERWIHHVVDDQAFADDFFFYRFYWDE